MSTAVRIIGRWDKSLNTKGEEIWGVSERFRGRAGASVYEASDGR